MPESEDSDEDLCRSAIAGRTDAFAALVRRHQSSVRQQLRRLTKGNRALVDDLAQECFLDAWKTLPRFRMEARFATWLYRLAYNRFLMHLRGNPMDGCCEDLDDAHDLASDYPGHDVRIDVERALNQLPHAQRVAVIHCYFLDLSHSEAADVLGIPLGTLKTQVLRAKGRLKELLTELNIAEAS